MSVDPKVVRILEEVLHEEIRLNTEYFEFLQIDRKRVSKFDTGGLEQCEAKRVELLRGLEAVESRRLDVTQEFPDGNTGARLSVLVESHCNPADRRRLGNLIVKLKKIVGEVREVSQELQRVSSFALRLVHGTLSILWSATQNVTRCYTAQGGIKDSYAPTYSRSQNVLKEV